MKAQTNRHSFLQSLTLGYVGEYSGRKLRIEVKKHRDQTPNEYRAKFFENVAGTWKAYCTSISTYIGDIIQDCKIEMSIYEQN
jgi:hypothetical protein